jgi:hypothetical protein
MMRQLMLTAKRTVTPAQAKGRITDPLDEGGAIRERLSVGKRDLNASAELVGAAMCSTC